MSRPNRQLGEAALNFLGVDEEANAGRKGGGESGNDISILADALLSPRARKRSSRRQFL